MFVFREAMPGGAYGCLMFAVALESQDVGDSYSIDNGQTTGIAAFSAFPFIDLQPILQ